MRSIPVLRFGFSGFADFSGFFFGFWWFFPPLYHLNTKQLVKHGASLTSKTLSMVWVFFIQIFLTLNWFYPNNGRFYGTILVCPIFVVDGCSYTYATKCGFLFVWLFVCHFFPTFTHFLEYRKVKWIHPLPFNRKFIVMFFACFAIHSEIGISINRTTLILTLVRTRVMPTPEDTVVTLYSTRQ